MYYRQNLCYKKGGTGLRVAPNSVTRFKEAFDFKELLCNEEKESSLPVLIFKKLKPVFQELFNYYRYADLKKLVHDLDE